MKKNIFRLSILALALFVNSSCKKCYECTTNSATTVTTGIYNNTTTTTSKDEFCGTKDEVADYEAVNTGTTSAGVPGASTSIEVRTNCNPK